MELWADLLFVTNLHMHAQMIIFRKFGIAFVSLFFKNCPSQQLSICLLLLFGCYVCQVANNPT